MRSGFGALLIRLTRQDSLSIVHAGPTATVVTLSAEGKCSFSSMSRNTESTQLKRQVDSGSEAASLSSTTRALGIPGIVGYRFLDDKRGLTPRDEYGLQLTIQREGAGLKAELAAPLAIGNADELALWLGYLRTLLNAAAADLELPVKHLPLLGEPSTLAFYSELNRADADFPPEECVHDLFARQASLTPDATAVISGGRRFSYRELEERSTRLASILIGMGAGPGRPIAICMERSADMPMALLAVLKTGSWYVPLDPRNPPRRLTTILEECRPVAVLSSAVVASTLQAGPIPVFCVDHPWPEVPAPLTEKETAAGTRRSHAGDPENLAYIIYTSGTTGQPKGAMIGHRSLTYLLCAMRAKLGFSSSDRLLAAATISFDMAVSDMFLPLITGGRLVVAGRGVVSDPDRLAEMLEQHDITLLEATPVTWRMLVNSGWRGKRNLKMLSAGEALSRELANQLLRLGRELWNGYGLTETTIYSSYLRLEPGDGAVRIGPPIANTSFFIMDEAGRPLPEGVPGELYIGGAGVGRGYLQRPELTAERFVENPFLTGGKLFRTGDLVRVVKGRELEFLGRLDHQIKLRGYRIELGEIESVLRAHPAVKDAVTVLCHDAAGEPRLVAYVTLHKGNSGVKDLREHAALSLPEYMIPQRIMTLEKMPLTVSGKIDRQSLPDPGTPASSAVEPENELERKLLRIFREVLAEPSIGVTGNFFEFGGYSLVVVRLFARIKRVLGLTLPVSLLFDAPTVRELAHLINEGIPPPIVVPIRPQGRCAPLFVIHSYLIYEAMSRTMKEDRPIYGLRTDNQGGTDLPGRISLYAKAIAEAYPEGPLCLIGWCGAASLTVEIGRQLMREGRQIGLLALIDADRPGYLEQLARHTPWKTKWLTSWSFHRQHLHQASLGAKLSYLGDTFRGRRERMAEGLSMGHRAVVRWLERNSPVRIPAALLDKTVESVEFPANYPWQPYPGRIVLFRASDAPELPFSDETLGWSEIAAGGVEVVFVPGTHESMFKEPYLNVFGEKLQEALEEIDDAAQSGNEAEAHDCKTP